MCAYSMNSDQENWRVSKQFVVKIESPYFFSKAKNI